MTPSALVFDHIRRSEGLRLTAYKPQGERCTAGRLTIGYGHLGARPGDRITAQRAEELLREDLQWVAAQVKSLGLRLTQGQFDALCDFVFNLGLAALQRSCLLRKIRAGAPREQIAAEFRRWVYSGTRRLAGLVARREWEIARFFADK